MTEHILTYEDAIQVVRDRCEVIPGEPYEGKLTDGEYARGQIEMIADLFGKPGVETHARMDEIEKDILDPTVAGPLPGGANGYQGEPEFTTVHVLLDNGEEFIVEVEEEVTEAMKSVDRRITEGEPIGARKIGHSFRDEGLYLIPAHRVTHIGARV